MCFIHLRFEIYVEFLSRNFSNLFLLHISHRSSDIINPKWIKYLQCLGFFIKKFQFLINFSWVNTIHTILWSVCTEFLNYFYQFLNIVGRAFTHTHKHTHDHWLVFGVTLISCVSHFILKTELSIRNLATVAGASDFEWSVKTVELSRLWNPLGLSSAEATTQAHTHTIRYIYVCICIICCLYSTNEHPLHSDFNCWAASGLSPSCLPAAIRAYEHEFLLR